MGAEPVSLPKQVVLLPNSGKPLEMIVWKSIYTGPFSPTGVGAGADKTPELLPSPARMSPLACISVASRFTPAFFPLGWWQIKSTLVWSVGTDPQQPVRWAVRPRRWSIAAVSGRWDEPGWPQTPLTGPSLPEAWDTICLISNSHGL